MKRSRALAAGFLLLAACAEELVLLTPQGELVEVVNSSTGLPTPLQGLGVVDGTAALRTGSEWLLADLDRLAEQGVRCTTAVSQYPVCTPFRAGLLTARHATAAGVPRHGDFLAPGSDTAARAFCCASP